MKNHSHIETLLDGYLAGTLSDTELKEFLLLINKEDHFLKSVIDEWLQEESFTGLADAEQGEMIFRQIIEKKDSLTSSTKEAAKVIGLSKYGWKHLLVAAGVFGLLLSGIWLILSQRQHQDKHNQVAVETPVRDVAPGGSKAILTLADGKQIILDSVQGKIVQQGNLKVTNLGGKLDYEGRSNTVEYHTLSTPRGGQYKLVLPDGSDVWLNAASSITFPTAFVGKERNVTITGEAYFEVAHNAKQPFHVKVNTMNIEVLGTHFNINSYTDESYIKTTLLEGSVKISRNEETVLLKPGQQASVNQLTGESITVTTPDMDEVMAWKNGRFSYKNTDLKTIMRQVMRWYDVDVEYKDNIPVRYFTADISRDNNLSAILKILELSNIHFRLEEDSSPGHAGKITVLR